MIIDGILYTWRIGLHRHPTLGAIRHLRVWRDDRRDGIPWDHLQQIKDEVLGEDVFAIEVYPPSDRVINEVNMRHLWEIPGQYAPDLYRGYQR